MESIYPCCSMDSAEVKIHCSLARLCLRYPRPEGFGFGLMLNVPVNNFSVMLGRSHCFLGITSTFWGVNMSCLRTQHGDPSEARTPTSGSGVRGVNHQPARGDVIANDWCIIILDTLYISIFIRYLINLLRYLISFIRYFNHVN